MAVLEGQTRTAICGFLRGEYDARMVAVGQPSVGTTTVTEDTPVTSVDNNPRIQRECLLTHQALLAVLNGQRDRYGTVADLLGKFRAHVGQTSGRWQILGAGSPPEVMAGRLRYWETLLRRLAP